MLVNGKYPPSECIPATGEQWVDIRSRLQTKRTTRLTISGETFEDKFPMFDPQSEVSQCIT